MANGYYSDGTISVSNGSTAVVGVGTAFLTFGLAPGDQLVKAGYVVVIASVVDDTHLTLAENWPGTTLSGATYNIEQLPINTRVLNATTYLTNLLGSKANINALAGLTGAADKLAYFTGSGTMALTSLPSVVRDLFAVSEKSPSQMVNVGLSFAVAGSALTVALRQADGATSPAAGAPCVIGFESNTLSSGDFQQIEATAATSLTVPSGATLGGTSGVADNLYVYAVLNAGAVELAISGQDFGGAGQVSTTAIGAGSTSATVMYSASVRSNVPFAKIAAISVTETVAGTWSSVPTSCALTRAGGSETEYFKSLKAGASAAAMMALLGHSILGIQLITASGTYTPTAGTQKALVIGQAGGGGGGGVGSTAGNGVGGWGGAGETRWGVFNISGTVSVTIGAAGSGATAGNNAGGTASDSSFGALMTCSGGVGGSGSSGSGAGSVGGNPPTGSGGIRIPPQSGETALSSISWSSGASTMFGAGGQSFTTAGVVGLLASGSGSGGAGGIDTGTTARAGGNGAAALFIVVEFP